MFGFREGVKVDHSRPTRAPGARTGFAWQPGWQTANERREEWYDEHGWAARPTAETHAEWAALQLAEDEYHSQRDAQLRDDADATNRSIGAEVGADVAPMLVVPAHPQFGDFKGDVAVELVRLDSGQPVVTAFTSVQRLIDALGPFQPWVQLPGATVVRMSNGVILLDPDQELMQPLWTAERINALREAMHD